MTIRKSFGQPYKIWAGPKYIGPAQNVGPAQYMYWAGPTQINLSTLFICLGPAQYKLGRPNINSILYQNFKNYIIFLYLYYFLFY